MIAAGQEQDPGTRADASDADDLPGGMNVPIGLDQMPTIMRERKPIRGDHAPHDVLEVLLRGTGQNVLDRGDEWRIADDPQLAVDHAT